MKVCAGSRKRQTGFGPDIGAILEPEQAMQRSIAIFVSLLILSTAFALVAVVLADRLAPEKQRRQNLQWLLDWCLKGLGLPFAVWVVMNLGVSWSLQPFMP